MAGNIDKSTSNNVCGVKLDRITVTGKFVNDVSPKLIQTMMEIGWDYYLTDDSMPTFRLNRQLSPEVSENKAVMVPNQWQPTWRLDTSNHLSDSEKHKVIKALMLMQKKHLTRIDVAFDFINCEWPGMKHRIIKPNISESYFTTTILGRGKNLETLYLGKRKSLSQIRYYDKLVEQKKAKQDIPVWIKNWERLELQLRGGRSADWQEQANQMLACFKLPSYESLQSLEKARLAGLVAHPEWMSELSRKSKAKYRELMKTTFNTTYADRAYARLRDHCAELSAEVDSFLVDLNQDLDDGQIEK